MRPILVFLLSLLAVVTSSGRARAQEDRVVTVDVGDAELNAAMAKARGSLDVFWKQFAHPDPGVSDLTLKIRISDANGTEAFWLTDIQRDGEDLSGTINNDADVVKSVRLGQRYAFRVADITDWSFQRNGKTVGNETARVLIKRLKPEEAKAYDGMFETP